MFLFGNAAMPRPPFLAEVGRGWFAVRKIELQGSLEFGCCTISTADGDLQGDEEERGKKNNRPTVKFIIFRLVCVNKREKEAVNNEKHFKGKWLECGRQAVGASAGNWR